jgi:hypothetical protein
MAPGLSHSQTVDPVVSESNATTDARKPSSRQQDRLRYALVRPDSQKDSKHFKCCQEMAQTGYAGPFRGCPTGRF